MPCASFVPIREFVAESRLDITVSTFEANALESTVSICLRLSRRVLIIAVAADPLSVIALNPDDAIAPKPWPILFEASIIA